VLLDDRGRARIFEVTIVAAVTIRDQVENRVIYDNQNYVFRGEFEFTNDRALSSTRKTGRGAHRAQLRRIPRLHAHQRLRSQRREMSLLTRQDLHRALKQGEIRPLYLLFGAETYLRDAAARTITDAALKDSQLREFNESSFS